MPKIVTPLTHTEISNAKPTLRNYSMADGQGLYCKIEPSGRKSWLFNFTRPHGGGRNNMSFGSFPAVSLVEARAQRAKCRELLAQNIDPKEHRDKSKRAEMDACQNTLKAVADRWFAVRKSTVTERYGRDVYNSLATHVFPKLGSKPLHLITAPETIETLKPVASRGNLELVRRICQRLNMIMNFAVNTGVVNANPLSGIKCAFTPPKKQHLPTIPPAKLPELMLAIENSGVQIETFYLAHWQLHTMPRPGEAARTRWCEIDRDAGLWIIPADRMKMKRQHVVPLTRQALDILDCMQPISGHREYVFPGNGDPRKSRCSAALNNALHSMGYKGILVSHGLRSIASTYLNDQQVDSRVVEKALSHLEKNETIQAYNRAEYLPQVREALQLWSDFIEACMPETRKDRRKKSKTQLKRTPTMELNNGEAKKQKVASRHPDRPAVWAA